MYVISNVTVFTRDSFMMAKNLQAVSFNGFIFYGEVFVISSTSIYNFSVVYCMHFKVLLTSVTDSSIY